jgi:hypothetical protein
LSKPFRNLLYDVFSENDKFLLAQLKKKHSKPQLAWTPKEIEDYSEWHELIDEICWLIKICYSSKDDIKHKLFRLDRLFVNYLTFHKVTLNKVRQVFTSNPGYCSKPIEESAPKTGILK